MKTAARYAIVFGILFAAGAAIAGAFGLLAFTALKLLGVPGATWAAVGWALMQLGSGLAALLVLDRIEACQ